MAEMPQQPLQQRANIRIRLEHEDAAHTGMVGPRR
jgi:hypothetical protein